VCVKNQGFQGDGLIMRLLRGITLALTVAVCASATQPISDQEVADAIIEQDTDDYLATGQLCACPYSQAANGWPCGRQSAYTRASGASPICYLSQVTPQMITRWRSRRED
jgi:hypothetical protein